MTEQTHTTPTDAKHRAVLKLMLGDQRLELSDDAQWDELTDHVRVHRYLVNEAIPWTITWEEAVFSWFENVFRPVEQATRTWEVRHAFPTMTRGQLYLAIATHWHYLKANDQSVTPTEAAIDFAATFGQGIARLFSRFLNPVVR